MWLMYGSLSRLFNAASDPACWFAKFSSYVGGHPPSTGSKEERRKKGRGREDERRRKKGRGREDERMRKKREVLKRRTEGVRMRE